MATSTEQKNMELMQTLDDAWNAQDLKVFRARHKPDVVVRWPGQPDPTVGIEDHSKESIAFWKTFPTRSSTIDRTGCSSLPATGPVRSPGSGAR